MVTSSITSIGKAIKDARKKHKIEQQKLASELGISNEYLSHALATAGVADLNENTMGVELVVTAPEVFILNLKVVAWIVAVE